MAALLLFSSPSLADEEIFTVGLACLGPDVCISHEPVDFFKEIYRRAGAEAEIVPYPTWRDLKEANEGRIQASAVRIEDAIKKHPQLIRVDMPVALYSIHPYSADADIVIDSWDQLHGLRVGVFKGMYLTKRLCDAHGGEAYEVNDVKTAVDMLRMSRLDVFIHGEIAMKTASERFGVKLYKSPVNHSEFIYHSVNVRHADMAPKLDKALREMLMDGTSARILGEWADILPPTRVAHQ